MLYEQAMSQYDSIDYKIPRATDKKEAIENYQIAKQLSELQKEPFTKVLNNLQRADMNKLK